MASGPWPRWRSSPASCLWFRGARLAFAVSPVAALAVAGVAVFAGKRLFARVRPPGQLHLVHETGGSFPSGHSADSTAVLLAIGLTVAIVFLRRRHLRALAVAASVALAGAIGLSRLELGVHWPTDVVAGWALGVMAAVTIVTVMWLLVRDGPQGSGTGRGQLAGVLARQRRAR